MPRSGLSFLAFSRAAQSDGTPAQTGRMRYMHPFTFTCALVVFTLIGTLVLSTTVFQYAEAAEGANGQALTASRLLAGQATGRDISKCAIDGPESYYKIYDWAIDNSYYDYDSGEYVEDITYSVTPSISIIDGSNYLTEGTDYEVAYANTDSVGTATVTITGIGYYYGSVKKSFKIISPGGDISKCKITGLEKQYRMGWYDERCEPSFSVKDGDYTLEQGYDYDVFYYDNTKAGTATVRISGLDHYSGNLDSQFAIVQYGGDISECTVKGFTTTYLPSAYTDNTALSFTIMDGSYTLERDVDYRSSIYDDDEPGSLGTHTVLVEGIDDYSGQLELRYDIVGIDLSKCAVKGLKKTYRISEVPPDDVPDFAIVDGNYTLKMGADYYCDEYHDYYNDDYYIDGPSSIGAHKIRVYGQGDYEGSIELSYEVASIDISKCSVKGLKATYLSSELKKGSIPDFTIVEGKTTLDSGTDYYVSDSSYEYDYEYEYDSISNPTSLGKHTFYVHGKGDYGGTIELSYSVVGEDLSKATIELSGRSFSYTGKAIKPSVTVKSGSTGAVVKETANDYEYEDDYNLVDSYSVEYSNNKNAGTATVKVEGIWPYTIGSKDVTFKIKPISMSKVKIEDYSNGYSYTGKTVKPKIYVMHGKQDLYSGEDYTVKYKNNKKVGVAQAIFTGKGNYTGKKIHRYKIGAKKSKITSFASKNHKSLTVKAKKSSNAKKYCFKLATNSKYTKNYKRVVTKKPTYTFKNLKPGTKYYVKVCPIARKGGKDYSGAWSASSTAKAKRSSLVGDWKLVEMRENGQVTTSRSDLALVETYTGLTTKLKLTDNGKGKLKVFDQKSYSLKWTSKNLTSGTLKTNKAKLKTTVKGNRLTIATKNNGAMVFKRV